MLGKIPIVIVLRDKEDFLVKCSNKREAAEFLVGNLNCIPSELILDAWKYANQNNLCGKDSWEIVPGGDMDADNFPMWGWVWGIDDSGWIDSEWVGSHIKELQDIGFTIIHHGEYGYFLGIDGAGYDFYKHHWIPLYDLLGFNWVK